MTSLEAKVEALLFHKGEPLKVSKLASLLKVPEGEINDAIESLKHKYIDSGLSLIVKDDEIVLGTSSKVSEIVEQINKEELERELSKAALETLTIVLYKGPVTRSDVDYIRGVNSQFIIRNLLIRGLIEKIQNPNDSRSFMYRTTFDLLAHLGLENIENMPEYLGVRKTLEGFIKEREFEQSKEIQPQSQMNTEGESTS